MSTLIQLTALVIAVGLAVASAVPATYEETLARSSAATATCDCTAYSFRITKDKGTYDDVRRWCHDIGGELLHENLGPAGYQYHT